MVNVMRKIRKNNSGMALVSIIVVIGFIAALVSIVLTTTLVNFKMRAVNERSKDNFYSAEQALDEVNIGLQRFVSDSMSEAYLEVMESYSEYAVSESMTEAEKLAINDKRNELLKVRYYEGIWEKLQVGDHHDQYDVTILDDFLKDSTRWHGDAENGYGAILVATDANDDTQETKTGKMLTYEDEGIVLKDLKVYYKDAAGFVSVIKTDIRLAYPEFNFNRTSEVPDIIYYSLIVDEEAVVNCAQVDMIGKIYANQLTVNGGTVTTNSGDDITIKYDLDLENGSKFTSGENTILWAKNIVLDSAEATLDGNINVANDVNLKGRNSKIKISGSFTGFGNSTTNAYKSSSILLNGLNSSIDVSKVSSLVLGGHTFAATSKSEKYKEDNPDMKYSDNARMKLKADTNPDLFMSESIAPKYNQMLYLVPANAIGVDKTTGISKYGKNPLTMKEYEEIAQNSTTYDEVNTSVSITELAGQDLSQFMATGDMVNRVFVRTSDTANGGGLVYYYMDFGEDEVKASNYFNLYYANNQESADKYMDFYINQILLPESAASSVDVAGTYFSGKKDDANGFSSLTGSTTSNSTQMSNFCDDKLSTYKTRIKCDDADILDTFELDRDDVNELGNSVRHHNYFEDKLVDYKMGGTEGLAHFVDTCLTGTPMGGYTFVDGHGGKIYIKDADSKTVCILCKSEGTKITSDEVTADTHLIITEGDVDVATNFNGLILSDGKVTFASSVTSIVADPSAVRNILLMGYQTATETKYITQIIPETVDYTYDDTDPKGDGSAMTLGGMISYENWTKD